MSGRLHIVGLGMLLGGHLPPLAANAIASAEVVFVAAADALVEQWVRSLHPQVRSLQPCYVEGEPRTASYARMVEWMLTEVRAGRRVCAAFYGHPGVFAWVPHAAIAAARAAGFPAVMEPGISAADCLYADLGLDPGEFGCQHHEASQLLLYRRPLDPSALLVVWQLGVVGDRSLKRRATGPAYRALLVERLAEDWPLDHRVALYEAACLPHQAARIDWLPLSALPTTEVAMHTTLVIPPARPMRADPAFRARLAALDADEA